MSGANTNGTKESKENINGMNESIKKLDHENIEKQLCSLPKEVAYWTKEKERNEIIDRVKLQTFTVELDQSSTMLKQLHENQTVTEKRTKAIKGHYNTMAKKVKQMQKTMKTYKSIEKTLKAYELYEQKCISLEKCIAKYPSRQELLEKLEETNTELKYHNHVHDQITSKVNVLQKAHNVLLFTTTQLLQSLNDFNTDVNPYGLN